MDLGLIRDDSIVDYEDLPDPIESGEEAIAQLEEAMDLLMKRCEGIEVAGKRKGVIWHGGRKTKRN